MVRGWEVGRPRGLAGLLNYSFEKRSKKTSSEDGIVGGAAAKWQMANGGLDNSPNYSGSSMESPPAKESKILSWSTQHLGCLSGLMQWHSAWDLHQ